MNDHLLDIAYLENLLHELYLFILDRVMDEEEDPDEAIRRQVTLRGDVHQEVHDLLIHLDLSNRLQELDLPLLIHPVVHEEL